MYPKLIVKNFGPIDDIQIDVKPFTVLIGPQGSGKSTLAKVLAICRGESIYPSFNFANRLIPKISIFEEYNLHNFLKKDTQIEYQTSSYTIKYIGNNEFDIEFKDSFQDYIYHQAETYYREHPIIQKSQGLDGQEVVYKTSYESVKSYWKSKKETYKRTKDFYPSPTGHPSFNFYIDVLRQYVTKPVGIYIPSERILVAALSNSLWSIMRLGSNLSPSITAFGGIFEQARADLKELKIDMFNLKYYFDNNADFVSKGNKKISLSESASGFQSIVPLCVVIESFKKFREGRFYNRRARAKRLPYYSKEACAVFSWVTTLWK